MTKATSKSATPTPPLKADWTPHIVRIGIAIAIVVGAMILAPFEVSRLARLPFHLKAPDFDLIARQPWVIRLHLSAALTALAIGCVIMLRPKGVGLHKALGWLWVAAMGATAVSSLFITGLNGDRLSLIHLLSGWVIIVLPMGVAAIRGRKVAAHRNRMTGLFVGGLLIAGAFTFIPGRLMWQVFFA